VAPLWAICHNKTHPREVHVTDKAERQLWKCEIVVLGFWLNYFVGFLGFSRQLLFKGCILFPQHAVKFCTEILVVHNFSILREPESSSGESYRNWHAPNSMGGT
jgi:hypothetical protein